MKIAYEGVGEISLNIVFLKFENSKTLLRQSEKWCNSNCPKPHINGLPVIKEALPCKRPKALSKGRKPTEKGRLKAQLLGKKKGKNKKELSDIFFKW